MAFIPSISEQEASGALAQVYAEVRQAFGTVPDFFAVQGTRPDVIAAEVGVGEAIQKDAALPRALKEKIGLVVSGINHSSYCIAVHSEALHHLGVPKSLARQLAIDYPSAPASEPERALFRFADKLTRQPADIAPADVEELRRHAWNDAHIHETVLATAWFNFVNRISAGLGLIADF